MTNIVAAIIITVTTNWVTVSTTTPTIAPGHEYDLVMRYSTANQIGARVTNTVALLEWKGEIHEVVLEQTKPFYEGTGQPGHLERSITVSPWNSMTNGIIFNDLHSGYNSSR